MAHIKIGITMGDPGGVGPEIVCRFLGSARLYRICTPVIFGSLAILDSHLSRQKTKYQLKQEKGMEGTLDTHPH